MVVERERDIYIESKNKKRKTKDHKERKPFKQLIMNTAKYIVMSNMYKMYRNGKQTQQLKRDRKNKNARQRKIKRETNFGECRFRVL